MWQAPTQKTRAMSNQKKRDRLRNRRPFHLRRVLANIRVIGHTQAGHEPIPDKNVQARVVLNDMSNGGLGLFSETAIEGDQDVVITIEEPVRTQIKAKVVWCQEFRLDTHIISAKSFNHRVGLKFIFASPEEEKAVQTFCEQLWIFLYNYRAA